MGKNLYGGKYRVFVYVFEPKTRGKIPLKHTRLSDASYFFFVSYVSYFFVSDFKMSIYSDVRCDGWIDCGRM